QAGVPVEAPLLEPEPMLPAPSNASRWWGIRLDVPSVEPIFEIPWNNWKVRQRLDLKEYRVYCIPRPQEPFEKHHIFPQEEDLAKWFKEQGIDIHAFTIRLPQSFHQWLHSGGPRGGQWNEAWRQFVREKGENAKQEDIWRFAGELMMRFGVNGPLVPYYCD
ncbi:MAG: SitA6 family polymorphic toxin lipoprotein, partial [Archangium sp.]